MMPTDLEEKKKHNIVLGKCEYNIVSSRVCFSDIKYTLKARHVYKCVSCSLQ